MMAGQVGFGEIMFLPHIALVSLQDDPLDRFVESIPASQIRDVPSLTAQLQRYSSDPQERLKAAFRWISKNVAYDHEGLRSGSAIRDAETCVRQRKGVCQAVAALFEQLGRGLGVQVETVTGQARNLVWTQGEANSTFEPHAWNRVRTPAGIRWFDPTWSLIPGTSGPVLPLDGYYWDLSPKDMRFSHIIDENQKEPEEMAYPPETIRRSLYWRPGMARYAGARQPALNSTVGGDGLLKFSVDVESKTHLIAGLFDSTGRQVDNAVLLNYRGNSVEGVVATPSSGWYEVRLFALPKQAESYPCFANLPVNVPALPRSAKLPRTFGDFTRVRASIVSGLSGRIPADESTHFAIRVPTATRVVLLKQGDPQLPWRPFTKVGEDLWEIETEMTRGTWTVCYASPDTKPNTVSWLIEYTVE
jgi:hypothetical protein